ncbi:hypothetical protein TNCV_4607631 [Trichonephila clavipes]|nr:hypothetical protein TNCV_4607631 [Trichonephila clavipes]
MHHNCSKWLEKQHNLRYRSESQTGKKKHSSLGRGYAAAPPSASRLQQSTGKYLLCLDNEHIFGGDQGGTPKIMDEILTTAGDLEWEVNEDDIEELIMGHEDELTIEELQEILNEEHQETQRN